MWWGGSCATSGRSGGATGRVGNFPNSPEGGPRATVEIARRSTVDHPPRRGRMAGPCTSLGVIKPCYAPRRAGHGWRAASGPLRAGRGGGAFEEQGRQDFSDRTDAATPGRCVFVARGDVRGGLDPSEARAPEAGWVERPAPFECRRMTGNHPRTAPDGPASPCGPSASPRWMRRPWRPPDGGGPRARWP